MKKNQQSGSPIIQAIILAILAFIAFSMWSDDQANDKSPDKADIPTSSAAEEAATAIADLTPTPGPAGEQTLVTEIPWQDVYHLGDTEMLRQALMGVYGSMGMDLRVSSLVETGALGLYCIQAHYPEHNDFSPLVEQVRNGSVTLIPKTRYCVGYAKLGELWGGVPQSDLQNFTLNPLDFQAIDPENKIITHTQTVDIELHVRFGLLTHSVQPGNEVKKTFDDPNGVIMEWVDLAKRLHLALFGGDPQEAEYFRTNIDQADNLANELATLELIAPLEPDGTRSTRNLDALKTLIEWHFNNPSPDANNPWPYDNLYALAVAEAKKSGYTGIGSFEVILEWPFEPDVWYYLSELGSVAPKRVIESNDMDKFFHNLYPFYRDEIGMDWVPTWENTP
ncbi:MAG: hypothetical protein BroJett025_03990 [Patescibacteria group bacterium]|nr:MAG: hypothetical protein BroJett025_03990 [Patescibacteria group bacterium]